MKTYLHLRFQKLFMIWNQTNLSADNTNQAMCHLDWLITSRNDKALLLNRHLLKLLGCGRNLLKLLNVLKICTRFLKAMNTYSNFPKYVKHLMKLGYYHWPTTLLYTPTVFLYLFSPKNSEWFLTKTLVAMGWLHSGRNHRTQVLYHLYGQLSRGC